MIEDLHWFGIKWTLGPGPGPESDFISTQNFDSGIINKNKKNQNMLKMKNKKTKTNDTSNSENFMAENAIKNNNQKNIVEKYKKKICSLSFFGVRLDSYLDIFHQSERMELYEVGLEQLFALGLGILFFFMTISSIFFHTLFYYDFCYFLSYSILLRFLLFSFMSFCIFYSII